MRKPMKPIHPVSTRLEQVREHFGVATVKDFWKELTQGRDYAVSYEAVRNYHFDREPPLDYLRQVHARFGVRLSWLVDGNGGMLEGAAPGAAGDPQRDSPYDRAQQLMERRCPLFAVAPLLLKPPIMDVWHRAVIREMVEAEVQPPWPPTEEALDRAARRVSEAINAPAAALGVDVASAAPPGFNIETYLLGVTQALLTVYAPPPAGVLNTGGMLAKMLERSTVYAEPDDSL